MGCRGDISVPGCTWASVCRLCWGSRVPFIHCWRGQRQTRACTLGRESHLIVCECVRVCASLEEGGDSPYGDGDPALRATWSSEAPEEIRAAGVGMIHCGSAEKLARGELGWGGPFSLPTADPGTRGLGGRGKGPSRGSSGSCRRHGGPERPSPESVSREPALAP